MKRKKASSERAAAGADPVRGRMVFVMTGCLGVSLILASRAAYLQLRPDARLEYMARRQFQSKVLIRPSRGAIVDRNGDPLAVNSETSSLAMNPSKITSPKPLARQVARALGLPFSKVLRRMTEPREFAWIKRRLTETELSKLKRWHLFDQDGDLLTGLLLVRESRRVYPHGELASHVLGDVNLDTEGTEGVELWMDSRLRGKVASVTAIKDALGRPAFLDTTEIPDDPGKNTSAGPGAQAKDGDPVTLTLDSALQYSVEEELRDAVHKADAKGGTVIVMNATTGEILAMANAPSFNPNSRTSPPETRRNRALTDGYEPGSTLKPVLLAAALEQGMHLTDQVWGEHGHFMVQGRKISEAEAHEQFEWLSLKKIIQVSSNVGAAKLALQVGADRYSGELSRFGFGSRTGLKFPGEISGRVPPRRSWRPLTLANVGFGQGILVTPLQMIRAYAAFDNGGFLVQPTLIKDPEPQVRGPRPLIPARVAAQITEALQSVTDKEGGGTGAKAVLPGYLVAGKTGTAQKVDPETGAYSRSRYVASFIGYPINVEPRVVIFTSIDEPHGVYYGGEVAAPLFREVLNAVANRFNMPMTAPLDPRDGAAPRLAQRPATDSLQDVLRTSLAHPAAAADEAVGEGESVADAEDLTLEPAGLNARGKKLWTMPSLKGLTPREAVQILQGHPFRLELRGSGLVRSQSPEEGRGITEGGIVRLSLSEPE